MTAVHRLVESARRRLQVSELLEVAALAFPVAGWAMLVWIVILRMFLWGSTSSAMTSLSMMFAIGAAIFLAHAALLIARRGWPSRVHAAAQLDERLNLASRISTALAVQDRGDAFSLAAVADANRIALDAHNKNLLARSFAYRFGPEWRVSLITALLVCAAWLFMPNWISLAVKKNQQAQQDAASVEKADQAEQRLIDAMQSAMEVASLDESIQKSIDASRESLDRAKQQTISPADREAQAFQQRALLEAALQKAGEAEELNDNESLKDALSELELSQGEEREMLAALKRGDFEAAAKEAQKLADKAQSSDPAEAAAAKQALEKVAAALDKQAAKESAKAGALKSKPTLSKEDQKKIAAAMKNAKQCNSIGKQSKGSCSGGAPVKNLMDLLKKGSAASSQKSSLSKSLAACRNPGSGGRGAGSGFSKPQLADQPDTKPKQFTTEQVMSESQDIDAEPIARDFVQGNATTTQEATRKLTVIENQVQAGLEEASEEDPVPAPLREAHQKYFSQWKKKIEDAKENQTQTPAATTSTPAVEPAKPSSRAP